MVNNSTFCVAFSIPCIKASMPTNASNGTAISVNANIPPPTANAPTPVATIAPIAVNGISNSVHAAASKVNALTFSIALSTFCIKANTPTKANNGTAISVKPNTPKAIFDILPIADIVVNAANKPVIAPANTINANTLGKAFDASIVLNNAKTPVKANNGTAIAVKANAPLAAFLAFTLNLLIATTIAPQATSNKDNAPADAIALCGSVK